MKLILKTVAALLSLGVLLSATLLTALYLYNRPAENIPSDGVLYKIDEGKSLTAVSRELEEKELIRSHYLLRAIAKFEGTGGAIKSGYYRIRPGMSTRALHDLLVAGNQPLHKVTIPEGLSIRRVARVFEEKGICSAESFIEAAGWKAEGGAAEELDLSESYPIPDDIASLEGFLFPDTYLFQLNYPAEKVVSHMVDTFFEKLEEIAPSYTDMEPQEIYKKLIVASIVEREFRNAEEADKIASVFYNRLERGMRLQSCATVVYVLTEEKGEEHPEKLNYEDLEVESDFNTYTRSGLPPAPIVNPGLVAIDAAFHPADTDYLFFLLQDPETGRHSFSKSLTEHNEAYRLYIKQ